MSLQVQESVDWNDVRGSACDTGDVGSPATNLEARRLWSYKVVSIGVPLNMSRGMLSQT